MIAHCEHFDIKLSFEYLISNGSYFIVVKGLIAKTSVGRVLRREKLDWVSMLRILQSEFVNNTF
jgi:hypothetical protein